MPRTNDGIVTISLGGKSENSRRMMEKVLEAIRNMPEYATDDAEVEKDTRHGGFSVYREPFVFHPLD